MNNLSAFGSFFSKTSMRTQLLESKGFKLPRAYTTRWNFNSLAVKTIHSMYEDSKVTFFYIIQNDEEWYSKSFNSATGVINILNKTQFILLLCLYI